MEKLYSVIWIDLPKETRDHLVKIFDISRTGVTEIRDQTVISDGFTNDDLQAITKERMAAYVGSPDTLDFARLWTITLSKVNFELHPPIGIIGEGGLVDPVTDPARLLEAPKKYCETCVSTAGRHRKGCPKYK